MSSHTRYSCLAHKHLPQDTGEGSENIYDTMGRPFLNASPVSWERPAAVADGG